MLNKPEQPLGIKWNSLEQCRGIINAQKYSGSLILAPAFFVKLDHNHLFTIFHILVHSIWLACLRQTNINLFMSFLKSSTFIFTWIISLAPLEDIAPHILTYWKMRKTDVEILKLLQTVHIYMESGMLYCYLHPGNFRLSFQTEEWLHTRQFRSGWVYYQQGSNHIPLILFRMQWLVCGSDFQRLEHTTWRASYFIKWECLCQGATLNLAVSLIN